jgi:hypothetical protein
MLYKKIEKCRICGNKDLVMIVDLGHAALTGVFPKNKDEFIESGPLSIVKCNDETNPEACGLLQMEHDYDLEKLYGDNYGYRSGLNQSMVDHLEGIAKKVSQTANLEEGDLIVDIGSNDGTLFRFYDEIKYKLLGIDPTASKFENFYPPNSQFIPDFFSAKTIRNKFNQNAKIITSIACFYDLERPLDFVAQVKETLTDDGIWMFEQSYMPLMIEALAYDTICHEHLEYYSMKQIKWMMDKSGMKIIDVELNDTNGGSFAVTVAKARSNYPECKDKIAEILKQEEEKGYNKLKVYEDFRDKINQHKVELRKFLNEAKKNGKKVFGYGASTKGNVVLQFCEITNEDIPFIAEVNEFKFGRCTPGTKIPIISEKEARDMQPDYFMVLPWHFKEGIIKREQEYLKSGGHLFFPLPKLEIV